MNSRFVLGSLLALALSAPSHAMDQKRIRLAEYIVATPHLETLCRQELVQLQLGAERALKNLGLGQLGDFVIDPRESGLVYHGRQESPIDPEYTCDALIQSTNSRVYFGAGSTPHREGRDKNQVFAECEADLEHIDATNPGAFHVEKVQSRKLFKKEYYCWNTTLEMKLVTAND
jgi:hypothetical protein